MTENNLQQLISKIHFTYIFKKKKKKNHLKNHLKNTFHLYIYIYIKYTAILSTDKKAKTIPLKVFKTKNFKNLQQETAKGTLNP